MSAKMRAVAVGSVVVVFVVAILVIVAQRPRSDAEARNGPATTDAPGQEVSPTPFRSASAAPPAASPLLLPDMRSLRPTDVHIEVVGGRRSLRFAASLANFGPGPLLLLPRGRTSCPRGQHLAVQVLHRDANRDGVYQRSRDRAAGRRQVGCMLRHPGHRHWHFDAMAAYSLRRPGTDKPLVSRNKVSFCLRDNRRIPRERVVVRREHFGRCARPSRQGISPGWVDVYTANLEGQSLRLPRGVDDEMVCLDVKADPRDQLLEVDETDNTTSVALRIDGTRVRRVDSAPCR